MKTIGVIAAVALLLLLVSTSADDLARATTLVPTYTVSLSNSASGANANITVDYAVDSPDARESHHVSFIPSTFGVATDAAVPNGAMVGQLIVNTTESTSNSSCSKNSLLFYDLMDATTDTTNVLADSPRIPSASWPGLLDANANGLPDAVDKYPNFLKVLYPGLTPRAREFGSLVDTSIALGFNRVVNVLVFAPGTALPGMSPLSAGLGYPVAVVFQDPTAPPSPAIITASCTPYHVTRQDFGVTTDNPSTAANEGGVAYRTNPAADGSYTFMEYGRTLRDLDNDGVENALDTCPKVSTPGWNPRIDDPVNDPDGDGIPGQVDPLNPPNLLAGSGCDPTPLTANTDQDGDGFLNRQDNCPLVANPTQADTDGDGIGDACDTVPTAADGHLHEVCVTSNVAVGTGGTPTPPTCPVFVTDMDNDGFVDSVEQHVGTNPAIPCGVNGWPADLMSSGPSTNKVDIQDAASFVAPTRHLNTSPGDAAYNVRWDLMPGSAFGKIINIQDIAVLTTVYPAMLGGVRAFNGPPCPYP